MFKLVVLFAVIAVAAARPGFLHHNLVADVVPLATSYSSRVDVHHKPLVHVQEVHAPLVAAASVVAVEPVVHAAPVLSSAVSYQSRTDIHHTPVVTEVHAPIIAHATPLLSTHAVHGW